MPNTRALNATRNLLTCGVKLGFIGPKYKLKGHRDTGTLTECPGIKLTCTIRYNINFKIKLKSNLNEIKILK